MPAKRSASTTRRLTLFQAGTTALLVILSALVAAASHAATSTIGRTWPIAEPDALSEIEARAVTVPPAMASRFGPRNRWSAMQAAALGVTRADRVRKVVPFYTTEFDVRLPDGRLLYPKGFTFNPLSYVTLPQRLVIVSPADLAWALGKAGATDWILLSGSATRGGSAARSGSTTRSGGAGSSAADPIALGERVGRPLFLLEERVKDRLGLTVAPVIVRQVGQALELNEVRMPRNVSRSAAR